MEVLNYSYTQEKVRRENQVHESHLTREDYEYDLIRDMKVKFNGREIYQFYFLIDGKISKEFYFCAAELRHHFPGAFHRNCAPNFCQFPDKLVFTDDNHRQKFFNVYKKRLSITMKSFKQGVTLWSVAKVEACYRKFLDNPPPLPSIDPPDSGKVARMVENEEQNSLILRHIDIKTMTPDQKVKLAALKNMMLEFANS